MRACAADHSDFVGDLAPEVNDFTLQEHFRQFFTSVRSAKVRPWPHDALCLAKGCFPAHSTSFTGSFSMRSLPGRLFVSPAALVQAALVLCID